MYSSFSTQNLQTRLRRKKNFFLPPCCPPAPPRPPESRPPESRPPPPPPPPGRLISVAMIDLLSLIQPEPLHRLQACRRLPWEPQPVPNRWAQRTEPGAGAPSSDCAWPASRRVCDRDPCA